MALRDDIKLLKEQKALLEASAEQTIRYGFEVKKNQDRLIEYNKKIKEIKDIQEKINNLEADSISLGKQINKLGSVQGTGLDKILGITKSINLAKEAQKSGDKEAIRQSRLSLDLKKRILRGEADEETILREKSKLTGKYLKDIEGIEESLKSTPGLSEKLKLEAQAQDKINSFRDKISEASALLSSPKAMGVATVAFLVKGFTDIAGEAIEIRKELGLSASESASLATKTTILSKAFSLIGGDGEQIAAFSKAIASEFGSINQLSFSTLKNFGLISLRTGISGDNAAKLAKSIQNIQGGSLETSLNTISTFENLSRAAGVAPKLVLDDIAESTELFAKFAKDGGDNLAKAAIEARKLGLNLSAVDKISESILDIEGSIEKQLEASVLLGRQLNLDKARELALSGDLEGVLAEVKNQVGGAEQLSRLNVIQRKALADAVGLEVSELSKLAAGEEAVGKAQEERNALLFRNMKIGAAIGAGLLGTVMALKAVLTSGFSLGKDIKDVALAGTAGLAGGAAIGAAAGAMVPRAQTGGVVRESGIAVVHKGETIAGTQFGGRESNKLLKQMIEQNATLMNRLTNKVGDLALGS